MATDTAAATAARITPAMLAHVLSRPHAVVVQDALGAVHALDRLDRWQRDDPDTVVLLTHAQAAAAAASMLAELESTLTSEGVLL